MLHPPPPPPAPPPPPGGTSPGNKGGNKGTKSSATLADYENIVKGMAIRLQMPWSKSLEALAQQGLAGKWDITTLQNSLYQTKAFHQAFVGIFNKDGSMKMQPGTYLAMKSQFQQYADRYGLPAVTAKQMGYLFKNNVSVSEFSTRAAAEASIQNNAGYFDAFNETLKAQGIKPLTTKQQLFNFVMGKAAPVYQSIWDEAATRAQADKINEGLVTGAQLERGDVLQIENLSRNPETGQINLAQQGQNFQQLAADFRKVYPQSQIQGMGLSKQDLIELEFGGSRQAAVAEKVQQIMANADATSKNVQQSGTQMGRGAAEQQRQY